MALGARRAGLLALVMRQVMTPVVAGLTAGVIAALALARAMRTLLFEVDPADPATIATVCLLLLFVGIVACLIPARRVVRADAVTALRMD
jgi:ABC-type lipoprotein release transport system permease subunit